MKLILKHIHNTQVVDSYFYSDKFFSYNDKIISIEEKITKLVYLISLTTKWKETVQTNLENGFYVYVSLPSYEKEYFFTNEYEENFLVFVSEMKKIAREG